MEPSAPPRRRTFDLPKPEAGLAEWMTKVKALQRQVDADEEAEQRRLEKEVAAARRARLRRSQGAGSGVDSIDFCESCTPTTKVHFPVRISDISDYYQDPLTQVTLNRNVQLSAGQVDW